MIVLTEDQQVIHDGIVERITSSTSGSLSKFIGGGGVGKTTIVNELRKTLEKMGYYLHFLAPTGQCVAVLKHKGMDTAKTIASFFYTPLVQEDSTKEYKKLFETEDEIEIGNIFDSLPMDNKKELYNRYGIPAYATNIFANESSVNFNFNDGIKLPSSIEERNRMVFIIDEISLITLKSQIEIDTLENIHIVAIGDNYQIRPIKSKDNQWIKKPDFELYVPQRFGEDSDIYKLSSILRNGSMPPSTINTKEVTRRPLASIKSNILDKLVMNADYIITGKRATRDSINTRYRDIMGYNSTIPLVGEKITFTKNSVRVYNGQKVKITKIHLVDKSKGYMEIDAIDLLSGFSLEVLQLSLETYDPKITKHVDSNILKSSFEQSQFAYAITLHSFQGSESRKILLCEEYIGNTRRDKLRWFYTGVTRARERLVTLY